MAEIPAAAAISTQSGNGKNASEAITQPFISMLKLRAFSIACLNASTRLVCPTPLDNILSPLASTIALDFVCLQIFAAYKSASVSEAEGRRRVTGFKSEFTSVARSAS